MDKIYISVEGIKIAYLEYNNKQDSKTVFFIHGNSVSSRTWRKQLNDPLFSHYRLVSIDLPAHGDSGIAQDSGSTYSLPQLASIMVKTVLQLTNDQPYVIAGISLSTNVVAEMLAYNIYPQGLILAGPSVVGALAPIANILKLDTSVNVVFTDEFDLDEVKKYAAETSLSTDEKDLRIFLEDFQLVKMPFRSTLANSIAAKQYNDEITLLQDRNIPLLVVFGKDEKVVENSYLDKVPLPLWSGKIYKIPDASHLVHIDQPMAFNLLMKEFLESIFK